MQREQQIAWNRQSLDGWEAFHSHRQQLTGLLIARAPRPAGRLAVLGAGNCNDLDLVALLDAYAEIQLLDWDREAVIAAVRRQGVASCHSVSIDAPVDLSQTPVAGPSADCVASLGLLSQWMLAVAQQRDSGKDPRQVSVDASALRRQHCQQMLARMHPGGSGLLSFEMVSSETLPELVDCAAEAVPRIVAGAVAAGNFYTGLHPAAVYETAQQLAQEGRLANLRMHSPWKWTFGPRVYAVAALSFDRPVNALY